MAISNPGGLLNSVPAPQRQALASNYLDFTASGTNWSQQYLPDLMEKEAEVFGPRTISGFLSKIGAEEAMTSDQVIWSEQGRLHLSYKAEIKSSTTIQIQSDIDGNNEDTTNGISGSGASIPLHGIRVNDTIIVATASGVCKAMVTAFDGSDLDLLTVAPYDAANMSGTAGSSSAALGATVLVYGSEYGKGSQYFTNAASPASTDSRGANEPDFKTFTNKPIILKDYYEVSGSDTSRIGWVEITGEEWTVRVLMVLKS